MTADHVTDAQNELQFVTATTLTRLIKEEPDPDRKIALLALAIRSRPAARHPADPARTRFNARPQPNHPSPANNDPSDPPLEPTTRPARMTGATTTGSAFFPPPRTPEFHLPPSPPLTPMTDDEFRVLERQIGHTEAHRRRLIRAQIIAEQARDAADSS